MRRSIRTRLIVWVLALLLPLTAGAGWLLIQVFGNRLLHDIDVALVEEAETVGELLATPKSTDAVTNLLAQLAAEADWGPRKYITIRRDGQLIAEAPPNAHVVLQSGRPSLRVAHYQSPDQSTTISIGVSVRAALHAQQRLRSLLAIGIPLILILVGTSLWVIIGRALRPLENASRQLEQVAAETLSVRIPVENPDDEVGRMVSVLNHMLDRLEHAVAELRHFTADAAHELRTPLTVLRTGLEVALARDRSAAEYRAALAEALEATDRMCRLAADLLTLARLEAAGAPRTTAPVDVTTMLRELADAWADAPGLGNTRVEVEASPNLFAEGDAGDLYRLFTNLIENAVRHGTNGNGEHAGGKRIVLTARRAADHIEAAVADDGPGIPPDDLPRAVDRFYRGRGQQASAPGTGLGLSIAQQIARTHGGQLVVANRDGGGCVVTVSLPVASSTGFHPQLDFAI
jgi:signal transduction histidine kinase